MSIVLVLVGGSFILAEVRRERYLIGISLSLSLSRAFCGTKNKTTNETVIGARRCRLAHRFGFSQTRPRRVESTGCTGAAAFGFASSGWCSTTMTTTTTHARTHGRSVSSKRNTGLGSCSRCGRLGTGPLEFGGPRWGACFANRPA